MTDWEEELGRAVRRHVVMSGVPYRPAWLAVDEGQWVGRLLALQQDDVTWIEGQWRLAGGRPTVTAWLHPVLRR